MANPRPNSTEIINTVSVLPGGDVFTESFDPVSYVNFVQASSITFSSPPDAPAMTATNLNELTWITGSLVGPAEAGAIFTLLTRFTPVAGLKYVFQFTDNVQGFSEVFYQNLNAIPANIINQLIAYITARLRISGAQTVFKRARVSVLGSRFSTAVYPASQLQAQGLQFVTGQAGGSTQGTDSDAPDVALVVDFQSASGPPPAAARSRRMFLRGIPDYVVQKGGNYAPDGQYATNLAAWVANGVIGPGGTPFGWFGQPGNGSNRVAITGLTNANGQVNIVLAAPGIFGAGPWPNTPIRIRGLTSPFRFLNGPLVVTPSSAVAASSIRNYPWPPGAQPQLQTAQAYLQNPNNWYPITGGSVENVGERRAGRPFGQQAGRRRNRQWS